MEPVGVAEGRFCQSPEHAAAVGIVVHCGTIGAGGRRGAIQGLVVGQRCRASRRWLRRGARRRFNARRDETKIKQVYGEMHLGNLVENAVLALSALNCEGHVLGFLALYAPSPPVPYSLPPSPHFHPSFRAVLGMRRHTCMWISVSVLFISSSAFAPLTLVSPAYAVRWERYVAQCSFLHTDGV